MFIYSIKATTIKFAAVVTVAIISLTAVILLVPEYTPRTTAAIAKANESYSYDKIKTNDDRVAFLSQFGWDVDTEPVEEVTMRIPAEFDRVMNTYNELQKRGGLDLSKYKGREVTRYSYNVRNYPGYDGTVTANVIVYKNRVIGGDVSSSDVSGFIGTFEYPHTSAEIAEDVTEGTEETVGSETEHE